MNRIQNHPAFHGRNAYATQFVKLDVTAQLRVLTDALGREHLHRPKVVSTRTCAERFNLVNLAFRQLADSRFKVRSVLSFNQSHVSYLASRWQDEGIAPATMQGRFSHLRWLAAAIGKPGLVREPSSYGVSEVASSRTLVAQTDKSWTAKSIDIEDVIARANEIDSLVAVQMRLIDEFGLRLREVILMRPLISHVNDTLRVEEGTKGGRSRVVPIRYQSQVEAIELAKVVAKNLPKGRLVPPNKSFDQAVHRFYYVMRLLGITKSQLGVTIHGLRHQYANDLYQEVSGQPSVVRGASEILDRARDREARRQVTNDLGHVRLDVTAAYTGPMKPRRMRPPLSAPPAQQQGHP